MADDPERAAALELLTDTWEKSRQLRLPGSDRTNIARASGFRLSFPRAAIATLAIAGLAVTATIFFLHTDDLSTAIGEQRTLTLQDGTRVYLNTNSRAVVHFDRQARRVVLEKGEALFEVAENPTRPFIVSAGDRQVRALGTAFIVRREPAELAVTLVEGKVSVAPSSGGSTLHSEPVTAAAATEVLTLNPGQRVTFATGHAPQLDRPPMERVSAWRRGQVSLDNTTLADAIVEMNRYNRIQLVVHDPQVALIRISGVFRAGDTENFVQALAHTYGLTAQSPGADVILVGPPAVRGAASH
jgi:transmembrane sensor